jgi:hypothetical protein
MSINYEKDVSIDGEALDQEWLNQASLMMKYCRISAQAQMELDSAKEMLDVVKAGLDKAIRENPEKYDIAKVTEVVIANTIIVQGSYTEAYGRYLQVKYEADMAKSAVRAIEQRKDALENLVRLYGQQYFAGPKMPLNISREWESIEKETRVNSGIAQRIRRRTPDAE